MKRYARPVPETLVVAAAIVDDFERPRRLLAARRSAPADVAGWWEFPGGKVETGEAPVAALHREIREELGVRIRVGDEIRAPEPQPGWFLTETVTMRLWLAQVIDGVPRPLEDHDELRWLAGGQWRSVRWLPADLAVLDVLEARAAQD
jgi:8-oxo-dGTP diphosphatase